MDPTGPAPLAGHDVHDTPTGDGRRACACSCGWRSDPVGGDDPEAAQILARAKVRHWMDVAGQAARTDPALQVRAEQLRAQHQRAEEKTLTKVRVTCTCGWQSPPLQRGHPRLAETKAHYWQAHVLDFIGFNASLAPPG